MQKIEKAFIQIYLCLVIALFLWNSVSSIRFPYGVDYGEAPLMDQARRLVSQEALYKPDINTPPFIISNYPPVYPSLVALANVMFKLPLFQAGRIASVSFALVCSYLIGLFAYHLTQNKWLGLFGAAVFLGQPYVIFWSSLARVDLMALAFSLLGFWVLYRYRDTNAGIILAVLCFMLSVFTRQTYLLAGPLAGFTWLWHLNRRRAVAFIALFCVSGLLIFGTINALSHGGFFTNIVTSNINEFNLLHSVAMGSKLFILWPFILLVAGVILVLTIYMKLSGRLSDQFPALHQPFLYFGLAFYTFGAVVSAVTIGKIGSNVNYLLELIAACSIWFMIAWKAILDQKRAFQWVFFGLLVVQSVWILTNSYALIQQNSQRLTEKLSVDKSLSQLILSASQKGKILSDDYMDIIVLSGQSIYYQPFEYGELYFAGQWNPSALVEQINQREFPMIIIGGTTLNKDCCWPEPVISALDSNYQVARGNDVLILTPMDK